MAKIFKHHDGVIKGNGLDIFEFGDLGLNIDDLPILQHHDYPQLNQYKYVKTKSACTIVGALIDACYLYEIKPTDQDMLECVEFANKECGYQFGKGWFADLGMRAVEKRFEQKYGKKLYYSTIRRDNPDFWKLLKKGYMLGFTYDGNYAYNKDYQSDSILDGNKFGSREYGHRTSLIYVDKKIYVVDSSAGKKYNVYEVKDLIGLIQNGVYDETLYIYTKEVDLPKQIDTKELSRLVQMRNNCKTINYNCNKQITLTNDTLYQNDLREMINKNDSKIKEIDEMIKRGESGII